ncbi:MAG: hypothetical protein ACI4RC_00920 [Oscillospiraceae bacterium]
MKISKIFAGLSAAAIMAAMAIPAAAGDGAPIKASDKWKLEAKDTRATVTLLGDEKDNPMLGKNEQATWDELFKATTARITVQGDYFGEENWEASGSIVVTAHMLGWGQVDWSLGPGGYLNEDGTVNTEKNKDISKIYVDGNKYTIEANLQSFISADKTDADISGETGLYTIEKQYASGLDQDYANFVVQSFNQDSTKGWSILGFELVDDNGNKIASDGEVAMGDVYYADGKYADQDASAGSSKSDSDSKGDAASNSDSDSKSSSTGSSAKGSSTTGGSTSGTSTSGSTSGTSASSSKGSSSDSSANTGAASGLALAGIALAGTALVIAKKRK